MSDKAMLWASLIGAAATIPLIQISATAATKPEIARIAKSITVLITEPNSVGSGVILQHQGDVYTVLTAAHVLKRKSANLTIATPDGQKYQAIGNSIRRPSVDVDLAIVKFRAPKNYPVAKLGDCNLITEGMEIVVGGYPAPSAAIGRSIFQIKQGIVTGNSTQVLDKGYSLIYDNQTLPGMSGGAVLNQNGELVAIHGEGDKSFDPNGEVKETKNGSNLGIPINRFAAIANSLGVNIDGKVAAIPQNQALKADDYYALAGQKYEKGDKQGAIADYDRAIALNPNYTFAYYNRGFAKSALGNKQAAIDDYNLALKINPNYANAYNNRGNAKAELGNNQAAIDDYNLALKINPNDAEAYNNRGNAKSTLGNKQAAIDDYNLALKINPNLAEAYNNRGLEKSELGNNQAAIDDHNLALKINPNYAQAYGGRGITKCRLGDKQGCVRDLTKAAELFRQQNRMDLYNKTMGFIRKL